MSKPAPPRGSSRVGRPNRTYDLSPLAHDASASSKKRQLQKHQKRLRRGETRAAKEAAKRARGDLLGAGDQPPQPHPPSEDPPAALPSAHKIEQPSGLTEQPAALTEQPAGLTEHVHCTNTPLLAPTPHPIKESPCGRDQIG